jgi:sugar phosphate isomerase/epimerase
MKTIKGPAVFLAQFIRGEAPFNTLEGLAHWASDKGFVGVQMPSNVSHIFDLDKAAVSQTYCDEVAGKLAEHGLVISELSTHLQGQCLAVHPA